MKIESIRVVDLRPDPTNARKHGARNLDAVKASLVEFGQQKPIVIDRDNVVRAGNGTLEAAKALGWDRIDCVRTDLDHVRATAYAIADNRTAELAVWDDEVLVATLAAMDEAGIDLSCIGFTEAEADAILSGPDATPGFDTLNDEHDGIADEDRPEDREPSGSTDPGRKYPLSIVLSRADQNRWEAQKNRLKAETDTTAFLRLLTEVERGEGRDRDED